MNYCYDECEHNKGERHYWSEGDGDKMITMGKSDCSNKKLQCELGFSQTVNSHEAYVNSCKAGSRICPRLKKLFGREG